MVASFDLTHEIEERWNAELRGETQLQPAAAGNPPPERSNEYNLHALHTLYMDFPKMPMPVVRRTYLKSDSFSSAVARLEACTEPYHQLKFARKAAKFPPPPVRVPIKLVREIVSADEKVEQALAPRRDERRQLADELKLTGGLLTCGVCFDEELLPNEAIHCNGRSGHPFCRSCVKVHAANFFGGGLFTQNFQELCKSSSSAVASSSSSSSSSSSAHASTGPPPLDLRMAKLRCPDMSGCAHGHIADPDLKLAMPMKDFKRYSTRAAALQALASGIKDLVPCPQCEFVVEMNDHADGVIRCLSAECGRHSCRWCGERDHRPLRCDQVEKDEEVRLRTHLEEVMTHALQRRCPNEKCAKFYDRIEGCNKMSCPCGTCFCYLCGATLDKVRPYDHYADGGQGGGRANKSSKCTVFGTPAWARRPESAALERAEQALQEYLKAHPELQQLPGERICNIRRGVGLAPTPSRKRQRVDEGPARPGQWVKAAMSGCVIC